MKLYRISENELINLDELISVGIYNRDTGVNGRSGWELAGTFEGLSGQYRKVIGRYDDKAGAQAALEAFITAVGSDNVTDQLYITYDEVTSDAETVRAGNTAHIQSVTMDGNTIRIALDCKVSELADFDGRGGWGVHKWLGIGISAGVTPVTGLYYNGAQLTSDDVTEASNVGLPTGDFVRWVAADLVLAGDNSQKSKDSFTLWADGHAPARFRLLIEEG